MKITISEFLNIIRGAKLLDHHTPRMEIEKHTWQQWRLGNDGAEYVQPILRNARNLGALRFEEVKSAGGIQ